MQASDFFLCTVVTGRNSLSYLPRVVSFQQLGKVVVFLLCTDFCYLGMYGFVIGGSINVADDAKSHGESVAIAHQGELQLQGVVLAVGIVYQYVVQRVAVFSYLYYLQTEALLYQSELVVLAEHQFFAVANIDSVLLASLLIIYCLMAAVVEDDTVLQNLADSSTLMLIGSLQNLDGSRSIDLLTKPRGLVGEYWPLVRP